MDLKTAQRQVAAYGLQVPDNLNVAKRIISFVHMGNPLGPQTQSERIIFLGNEQREWIGKTIRREDGLRCKVIAVAPVTLNESGVVEIKGSKKAIPYWIQIELPGGQRTLIIPPTKEFRPATTPKEDELGEINQ